MQLYKCNFFFLVSEDSEEWTCDDDDPVFGSPNETAHMSVLPRVCIRPFLYLVTKPECSAITCLQGVYVQSFRALNQSHATPAQGESLMRHDWKMFTGALPAGNIQEYTNCINHQNYSVSFTCSLSQLWKPISTT